MSEIIKESFSKIRILIESSKMTNDLIDSCRRVFDQRLLFSTPARMELDKNKEELLKIYQVREEFERHRKGNEFVTGYDQLMPVLTATSIEKICISSLSSEGGTYIIFTDPDYCELIGILKSKRTYYEMIEKPTEVKQSKLHGEVDKHVFIGGELKNES